MKTFFQFLENQENKSDLDKAKDIANNITKMLKCKKGGTCMAFASWFTKVALKKDIKNFIVVEGWVKYKEESIWRQHTWIEMDGEKIDPTFDQFSHYENKPSYVKKVKARYTPQQYLELDKKYPLSKSDWKDAITENSENQEDEIEYQGSVNFMDRIKSGYTIGQPRYADYEPHHQRHPGGAWTYVNMFHKETEDELIAFFDDQTIDKITVDNCIWSKKKGLRLIRSAGDEIKVPSEKNGKEITINSYSDIIVYDQKGNQKNFDDADDDQDEFEYFNAKLGWF